MSHIYEKYKLNGFLSPIKILNIDQARQYREKLEDAEKIIGSLHYKAKTYLIMKWVYELATNNNILDIVEKLIGSNILLHNATFIIKEPKTASHVSWHQDLTYWGFSNDNQVSAWIALSTANETNGCMKMIPGSHKLGKLEHTLTNDKNNVLLQGQTVKNIKEQEAVLCPLLPGEASFHHGWTLHKSKPNNSDDRRIGLNIQYLSTNIKQTKNNDDTAICVKGIDEYKNFKEDKTATKDLDLTALENFKKLCKKYNEIAGF